MPTPWKPSNRQMTTQWWARFLLRYGIGGGGLMYEVLLDHLKNPTALVVFGGVAGVTDVLGYRNQAKHNERADRAEDGE